MVILLQMKQLHLLFAILDKTYYKVKKKTINFDKKRRIHGTDFKVFSQFNRYSKDSI